MNEAKPNIEVVQLTPELAQEFLSYNTSNYRNPQSRHVQELVDAMQRGEFSSTMPSNDAIAFAEDGTMTNGQNRCLAVVKSGITICVIVMRGGSIDTADVMDQGAKRSVATILTRHGYSNTSALAGTVRAYSGLFNGNYTAKLTTSQILNFVEKNYESLRISISHGQRAEGIGIPRAMGAGLHFAAGQADMDKANEFFSRLADGVGLYPGNPVQTLRVRALKNIDKRHRLDKVYFSALMIKAWSAWYDRRSLSVLKWRTEQNPDEPFPALPSPHGLVRV